jgi:DNA-binding transcriptional MerR regulator/effector-binding domain-containing protein
VFSIGEFSKIAGLSVKTLRFYHEKGLLVPAAIDPGSGYRRYDERNVDRARIIGGLRSLEFSLDEIAEILAACSEDQDVLVYLDRQKESLGERIKRLRIVVKQLDQLIGREREARDRQNRYPFAGEIQERDPGDLLVAGIRMVGRYDDCGKGFATLGRRLGRNIAGPPICLYYDGEYREQDAAFEPCMPVRRDVRIDGIEVKRLPGGKCVSLVHRGPYEELGRSYAGALRYVKDRGYKIILPTREVYLKGPGMIFRGNPQKYLTEIQLPVEPQ